MQFVAPSEWPQPPPDWRPTPGWTPDPSWPPAPRGWQFWWESGPRRRKGFRGWLTSMLPTAPRSGRPRVGVPSPSVRRCWLEAVGVVALFFGVGVIAAVLYDGGQKINPSSLSISESALTGLEALTHAVLAIVVVIALSRLRGLRPADLGLAPRWASRRAYRWQGLGVGLMFIVAVLIVGLLLHFASPSAHYPFLPPTAWNLLYEIP